jgi:hypothetical protein
MGVLLDQQRRKQQQKIKRNCLQTPTFILTRLQEQSFALQPEKPKLSSLNLAPNTYLATTESAPRKLARKAKSSALHSSLACLRTSQIVRSKGSKDPSTSNADTTKVEIPFTFHPKNVPNSKNASVNNRGLSNVLDTLTGTTKSKRATGLILSIVTEPIIPKLRL